MAYFNLLLTVTSDIIGVLFALFNPVFVRYIRFTTVNKRAKRADKICKGRTRQAFIAGLSSLL
jgi:hypothetical protein